MHAARMSAAALGPNAATPTTSPSTAFVARSTTPPRPTCRPALVSRATVNSRPRKKSRKMIPIAATNSVTSDGLMRESTLGSLGPRRRPASRYAGIADRPNRRATSPSAPRTAMVTASSASVTPPFFPPGVGGAVVLAGAGPIQSRWVALEDPVRVEGREAVVAPVDERVVARPGIHGQVGLDRVPAVVPVD